MRARNDSKDRPDWLRASISWAIGFAMGLAALAAAGIGDDERPPEPPGSPPVAAPKVPVPEVSAPVPEVTTPVACREDVAAWDAVLDGLGAHLRLAAQVADLESTLAALRAGAIDGPSFVRAAVHSMPEQEIRDVLAATAKLDAARLDSIEDIQGYAVRLADIAMEGVLAGEPSPVGAGVVEFSTRQEGRRARWTMAERFAPDEDRLYAFFDPSDWPSGHVMVRWRHVESGEVLLLEPHRVRAGVPRGFVWLSPSRQWEAGTYQVDVYADDEALGHLATGRYVVEGDEV